MSEHESTKTPRGLQLSEVSRQEAIADVSSVQSSSGDRINDCNSDDDSDGDSDGSSFVSETSTIEYEQEPHSSYQDKVIELSKDLFPDRSTKDIGVERIKGGADNRIVGLTLLDPEHRQPWYRTARLRKIFSACVRGKPAKVPEAKQYILRIPRDDTHALSYQSIALSYLGQQLAYPVPKCVAYDSGANNPLGQPYMLQKRLPGTPLHILWPELTHEQRKCAARCIAEIVRDLHKIQNTSAGIIGIRNTTRDLETGFIKLEPTPLSPRAQSRIAGDVFKTKVATPQTTRDFLLSTLDQQQEIMKRLDIPQFPKMWAGFANIVNKVHADGLLPDNDPFFLQHGDLYPRNLLFTTPTPSTVRLSGIVDWDHALFVPKYMSTRPPFYLWAGLEADEDDEDDASLEPEEPEMREYKRIFEGVVGEQFYSDSYRKEYFFLRRMWRYLLYGTQSSTYVFLAEQLLQEWEAEFPTSIEE